MTRLRVASGEELKYIRISPESSFTGEELQRQTRELSSCAHSSNQLRVEPPSDAEDQEFL